MYEHAATMPRGLNSLLFLSIFFFLLDLDDGDDDDPKAFDVGEDGADEVTVCDPDVDDSDDGEEKCRDGVDEVLLSLVILSPSLWLLERITIDPLPFLLCFFGCCVACCCCCRCRFFLSESSSLPLCDASSTQIDRFPTERDGWIQPTTQL